MSPQFENDTPEPEEEQNVVATLLEMTQKTTTQHSREPEEITESKERD